MELFKGIAIFIGWLSGSLAGVGAILYAFGYLISRAQLNLLGLQGLVGYEPDYYLQEGAKFFVVLAANYLSRLFPWLYVGGLVLLVFLPLVVLATWIAFRRRAALASATQWIKVMLARMRDAMPWSWRHAAFVALALILLLRLTAYLNPFVDALSVENILYTQTSPAGSDGAARIRALLTSADRADIAVLKDRFGELLVGELEVIVALVLVWGVSATSAIRLWLASPFIVVLSIYTVLLPLAYGVLVRPNKYPLVAVTSESPLLANLQGELFLLRKTGDEFVVWDKAARRVIWLPKDQVKAVEVRQSRLLFKE